MKNYPENTSGKRKPRKRFKAAGLILTAAALITVFSVIILLVRMFGEVGMSTSDISEPASTPDTTTPTLGTTIGSSSKTAPTNTTSSSARPSTSGTTGSTDHYIQPAGAEWNLRLVNKWNPLESGFQPPLATYAGSYKFDSRAIDKLKALVKASNGRIRVTSVYRSIEKQTELYYREVNLLINQGKPRSYAEEKAAEAVARPGTSEHNLGLAVDFLFDKYSSLETKYEKTETYQWMLQNCAKYGFILRFPKDKTHITGVMFEPWHYRYVGEEAAQEIMSRGLTLEEYLREKGK